MRENELTHLANNEEIGIARPMLRAWRDIQNTHMQSRSMLRAWRAMVDGEFSTLAIANANNRQLAKRNTQLTFQTWSKSVPARTRQWARLFSKLEFEYNHQHSAVASPRGERCHASAGAARVRPGVSQMFGVSNPKELRTIFKDFMKDLSKEEQEDMRFALQAEAISRGLGKYSISARKKYF